MPRILRRRRTPIPPLHALLRLLGNPHPSTRPQPTSTRLKHPYSIAQSPNTPRSFNQHLLPPARSQRLAARSHQPHVLLRGAGSVEARGRFDEVEIRRRREHAACDDLRRRVELRCFQNEFELDGLRGLEAQSC